MTPFRKADFGGKVDRVAFFRTVAGKSVCIKTTGASTST